MITTTAPCRINGLCIMELTLRTNDPNKKWAALEVVYATLEKNQDGSIKTHGRCTATDPAIWSKRTLELLNQATKSMEDDLLPRHFKGAGRENENDSESGLASSGHEEADQV